MKIMFKKFICILLIAVVGIVSLPYTSVRAETNKSTNPDNIKKISLNESNLFLELNQSKELILTVNPINSIKGIRVQWTTSDFNVVTVHNGTVYAKGLGTAYVYANAASSIAFCKITVIRNNPVRAVQNKVYTGYSGTDLEVVTKAAEIIDSNIKAGMSDEEKIKAIHGYLLSNCDFYNLGLHNAKKSYYGLVGALIEKTAVMEGYAYSFKYLMDILGVSTRISERKYGMWNQVYLHGRWYAVIIPMDELSYSNRELEFDPKYSNVPEDVFPDAVIHEEVNFEYILFEYGNGSYSGSESAVQDYIDLKEHKILQKFTVILDPNFTFSKELNLTNGDKITESIQDKSSFIPIDLPYIKGTRNIYVHSFNTKADGTGISYPYNFVKSVEENMYLYCIWKADVEQVRLKLTSSHGSLTAGWDKVSGCKKYELRYSTNSSMKNSIRINVSGYKTKINGLKQKTTYYVQVRGYIIDDNGQITYGKWSMKNKVSIK